MTERRAAAPRPTAGVRLSLDARQSTGTLAATGDDPTLAARAAGLRYTTQDGPGISRRRAGRGWSYRAADGALIRDPATLTRIRALAIPPAWRDVWINPHPRGHIQATGRDARGRKQYRYHPRWRKVRDETKFGRMIAFAEALPALRQQVNADLARPGLSREKTLATVVRLLEHSLIRVGNAEYARDNGSIGLTTMRHEHVDVNGSTVRFTFRGKSGKEHEIAVCDKRIARLVRRLQDLPGQPLFQYLDDDRQPRTVDSDDVNTYLRAIAGEAFTAKDFRTWAGTVLATRYLRDLDPAETKTATAANIVAAIDAVAARLGNTRAVCRASYIHPVVLTDYESGAFRAFSCESAADCGLDPDEQWLLAYLKRATSDGSETRIGK